MEAKKLKQIIQDRGIKQTWIARKMGVSRALINMWVSGAQPIPERWHSELQRLLK